MGQEKWKYYHWRIMFRGGKCKRRTLGSNQPLSLSGKVAKPDDRPVDSTCQHREDHRDLGILLGEHSLSLFATESKLRVLCQ